MFSCPWIRRSRIMRLDDRVTNLIKVTHEIKSLDWRIDHIIYLSNVKIFVKILVNHIKCVDDLAIQIGIKGWFAMFQNIGVLMKNEHLRMFSLSIHSDLCGPLAFISHPHYCTLLLRARHPNLNTPMSQYLDDDISWGERHSHPNLNRIHMNEVGLNSPLQPQ